MTRQEQIAKGLREGNIIVITDKMGMVVETTDIGIILKALIRPYDYTFEIKTPSGLVEVA